MVQAWPVACRYGRNCDGIQNLDYSLAAAAQAGDWQMVELITTAGWPDPEQRGPSLPLVAHTTYLHQEAYAASVLGPEHRFAPDVTYALKAIVYPAAAAEAERHLRIQQYPLYRQTTPNGGSGCGRGSSDGQQGHSTISAACNHDTGGSGIGNAGSTTASASNCNSSDASEVEQEVADETETPSLQHYTPSRSKAAVLLIRAGASLYGKVKEVQKLALSEGNEELMAELMEGLKRSAYWESKLLGEC
jgi:hypothetical protein